MKVHIYGECEVHGSGAWCYRETLKEMGHDVTFFSPESLLKKYKRNLILRGARKLLNGGVFPHDKKFHIRRFMEGAFSLKPDIIIVLKGLLIDGECIERLRDDGIWVVLINHDDFFSQFKYNTSPTLIKALPYYNYIFCTKEVNVDEVKKYNKAAEMFLFAFYPRIHYPPNHNSEDESMWSSDVVFVGNAYQQRIKQLEYLVTNINHPIRLKIYGLNWERMLSSGSPLWKHIQKRALMPAEMQKAIYYAKVSLGFLCKENRDDYTQRSFEIPAIGGLLLAERTNRHKKLYKEDSEAVFFDSNDFEELLNKLRLLLDDDKKRKSIAKNGHQKVWSSNHTYKNRLDRIFEIYEYENSFFNRSNK